MRSICARISFYNKQSAISRFRGCDGTFHKKTAIIYAMGMTIPINAEENIETLLHRVYPELTEAERQEVRLDLELIARWLLEQVELGNPVLEEVEREANGVSRES